MLFAVEIILHEVSVRTLVPVVTATATATYVGQLFFGPHPSFSIPALETHFFTVAKPLALGAYAGLGAIAGLVSALFIWSIYGAEEIFEKRVKGGYYVQHIAGMLLVGVLMYGFMVHFGHYYIEGVGYATIQDVLTGALLRGETVPETMRADVQFSRRARSIMHAVNPETPAGWLDTAGDGTRKSCIMVRPDASLWDVISKLRDNDASVALVTSNDGQVNSADVMGVITLKDVLDTLADEMELFGG